MASGSGSTGPRKRGVVLLPPIGPVRSGCGNCPPKPQKLDLRQSYSPGFGIVYLTRDGEQVLSDEAGRRPFRGARAEKLAAADPEHDWRIEVHGPLGGAVYQRHGEREWVAVERLDGFA